MRATSSDLLLYLCSCLQCLCCCVWQLSGRLENDEEGMWWELFDDIHQLPYFYHTKTKATEWIRPTTGTLVNLRSIQRNEIGKRVSAMPTRPFVNVESENVVSVKESDRMSTEDKDVIPEEEEEEEKDTVIEDGKRNSIPIDIPQPRYQTSPILSSSAPLMDSPLAAAGGDKILFRSISAAETAKMGGISHPINNPKAAAAMSPFTRPNRALTDPQRSVKPLQNELRMHINQLKIDAFAHKFFATHTRGIFRRRVPIEKMLQWSKESLRLPLMVINKNLHKEALKCFKVIQRVMGDRATGKGYKMLNDIQWLLEKGVFTGEMRDEIYVLLCKQLTNNPDCASIIKGWNIMSCLVCSFPPSRNFEAYLKSFIVERVEDEKNELLPYARFCRKKLDRICRSGPRGKTPTMAEIENMIEGPFSTTIFGETLDEIMAAQHQEYPHIPVPRILPFLAVAVISLQGCTTEGIFRVPGDVDQITELRLRIEKNRYDLTGIADPNIPAGLLKFWLRDLAEPLIPTTFYEQCIGVSDQPDMALKLVEELPENNRLVAQFMIRFLQIVGEPANHAKTKMTIQNIAMVFAPNFLRCPSDNPTQIFENTKYEQSFIKTLMQHSSYHVDVQNAVWT